MDTATRVQILNEADCILQKTYTLWKMYESSYSPSSYALIARQTGFLSLGLVVSLEKWKLWIQTCKIPLKIGPVSHPALTEGLVNRDCLCSACFHVFLASDRPACATFDPGRSCTEDKHLPMLQLLCVILGKLTLSAGPIWGTLVPDLATQPRQVTQTRW